MTQGLTKLKRLLVLVLLCSPLIACTSMQHIDDTKVIDNSDPLESENRFMYNLNDGLDENILRPIANTYVKVTPEPFRIGITNFFNNVHYLNVILNNSLQGKIDQSVSDIFRFVFNSTLGIGGLFDVATPMGLEANKEDVGQTLAVWGSPQGPYLSIPAMGPNTVRNLPNFATKYFLNPFTYVAFTIALPVQFLKIVNTRANLLNASNFRDSAAIDAYSFTREAYLQSRKNLIYDGNPPAENFDDIFEDIDFDEESL